jgi:cobalt-zinc-cadmium resistance protein CzcA
VKGENSVKIVGPSVEENEKYANQVVDAMKDIRGITDLGVLESLGQRSIRITPIRSELDRYGLNPGDVNTVVQTAVGGNAVVQVYEGEKLFDLTVRWLPEYRGNKEAMKAITIATPNGMYVPLGQVADVDEVDGPVTVFRQDGQRYSAVKFGVRGRDLESAISEAQARIHEKVHLPYNAHFEWEGEIEELHKIEKRLALVIPLTLLLIGILTYIALKNWLDTVLVLVAIPVACAGGVIALLVTGEHFSVSNAMGFVSIFGIAIQESMLVVTYFQRMRAAGQSIEESARQAAEKCFRPVLMTTLVATLGLTPAALSHGIGSETQKPLAIVVIGGSLFLALLTRVRHAPILVVAHTLREKWLARRGADAPPPDVEPTLGQA